MLIVVVVVLYLNLFHVCLLSFLVSCLYLSYEHYTMINVRLMVTAMQCRPSMLGPAYAAFEDKYSDKTDVFWIEGLTSQGVRVHIYGGESLAKTVLRKSVLNVQLEHMYTVTHLMCSNSIGHEYRLTKDSLFDSHEDLTVAAFARVSVFCFFLFVIVFFSYSLY
jgi:hypothetical protein